MVIVLRPAVSPWWDRSLRQVSQVNLTDRAVIANADVWVAERASNLVGFLVLYGRDDHLLAHNVVGPHAQRSGIGRRLLDLAGERARAAGLPEVQLCTSAAMTENLASFARHGYRQTHRAAQDGFERVFFSTPLSAA